jgi:hypothetical protein
VRISSTPRRTCERCCCIWVDQRRGWRFTHPNLEELGFLRVEYIALDDLAEDEAAFAHAPAPLKNASPQRRATLSEFCSTTCARGSP